MRLALASAALLLLIASCGGEDGQPAPNGNQPSWLQTPRADRQLPEDAYAVAWSGVGEAEFIVEEALPAGYHTEPVASGLSFPSDLAFLPDGRILVNEQYTGAIRLIENGILREEPFAVIEQVVQNQLEQGLLGIAVDPAFAENHAVYVFYVEGISDALDTAQRSVLLRLTEANGVASDREEISQLPFGFAGQHNGGGLRFGPDGYLYISIGDTSRAELAPDPAQAVGKILRVQTNGFAAPDNPLVGTAGADDRVYASGFRNVYGMAFHPALPDGLIVLDNAEFEGDEIDIVRAGLDYGWPDGAGEEPIWSYLTFIGPAGAVVYAGSQLPEFRDNLFFCQFHYGGALHRVELSDDLSSVVADSIAATGCSSSVAEGPDGFLYFLDREEGTLSRIVPGE